MHCMKGANNKGYRKGFTFIEILIVTVLLSIVSLTIFSTFNNGIKIWQRMNTEMPEEDVALFFEKFTVDVRNCVVSQSIGFMGSKEKFEFCGLVKSPHLKNASIGKVFYAYDPGHRQLTREQRDYSQLYQDEPGLSNKTLANVSSLKFEYYFYDEKKKEYLWKEEWLEEYIPLAIRISFELSYGQEINLFVKTVSIPVSS